ncbi:PAS domain S-box protein [Haloarcula marismortui]|uniref:HTR-like protein n=1 Tax=Haloarcula marismortui ATCC 33800 TaxID=662476 RepID=M0JYJ4_9EURY|nr:PAS domain S-box protein [Haloarcula sinaiiensis]EMA13014.1 HTR-like protein [Haloarcula sinaiiensis ATCC 33800]QUJ70681.1 PAS domain S-box protein [Haloarcula sinaiiensis ATCC 33800]
MAGSVRVLHVDDEPDFADLTAAYLERTMDSFTVDTAMRADEVIVDRPQDTYDCIISDYDMPGMNGLAFLERIREDAPKLPFILYTGKGSEEIAAEAISAGVTDYIQKEPGTSQYTVLANRVQNAVEARRDELQVTRGHRAMNAAWDGISTLDHEGRFTYLNDAYAATFGYEREELLGDHWQKIHSAEGLETVNGEILPAVDETGTWTGETLLERADGTQFIGEHTVASIEDDGAVCVVRDRTDREELDKQLRHERERFRLLVDAVENYAIFLLDPDGLIQSWNVGAKQLTQYEESDILGEHVSTFHTEKQVADGIPEQLLQEAEECGKAIDRGLRVRKDGSTFWADVTVTALQENSDARGFAKVIKDITGQIERERQQAMAERYREKLYEITNDSDRRFEQRLVDVLELGVEYLDVDQAHLVAIDPEAGTHEIIAISGDPSLTTPGDITSLSETYCRRTVDSDGLLSIYSAEQQGLDDDPAYQRYGIGCYLGAKIEVDGELFGTVCFVARDPRSGQFRQDEQAFVELLTRWFKYELSRRDGQIQWPLKM